MCTFTIPFTGDTTSIIQKARGAVESQQGRFTGDDTSGDFDVSVMASNIRGSYHVQGSVMNIEITKKPFFVPCSTIENFLKGQIT